jgi:hypothetical protein
MMPNVSPNTPNSLGGDVSLRAPGATTLSNAAGGEHVAALIDLQARLRWRRRTTDLLDRYYHGAHRLAYATSKYKEAFGTLFEAFADNWCAVVADVASERLKVEGFISEGSGDGDSMVNKDAWDVWTENDMPLYSTTAHLGAIVTGHSYVLVDNTREPDDDNDYSGPYLYVWPSSMAILRRDPVTRKPSSGMTTWVNDDGTIGAEVYLPSGARRFKTKDAPAKQSILTGTVTPSAPAGASGPFGAGQSVGGIGSLVPDPAFATAIEQSEWLYDGDLVDTNGDIPLVEFTNRPNELGIGRSDIADVLSLQDAINKLANDMIVASEFQAFKQRVLTGVEIPKNPETGEPLRGHQLEASMARLWSFEPADAKVTELNGSDLDNWVKGIKELLNHLAAQTRTPPHYLLGAMVNISGDALAAAESGLVYRVEAKQESFGVSWEEVMRLAGISEAEAVWKNPERASFSIRADAVQKLSAPSLGIPIAKLWRMLGFSPIEIQEMLKKGPDGKYLDPRVERAINVGVTQATERINANVAPSEVDASSTDTTVAAPGAPTPAPPAPPAQ